jgi:hypothetical protein
MPRYLCICRFALLMLGTSGARAGSIETLATPCHDLNLHSLQDYLDLSGAKCSVGILNFRNFNYITGGTTSTPYSATNIELTPVYNPQVGSTGFAFSIVGGSQFVVGATNTATYEIDYRYDIDAGPISMAADLGMDPPFGDVSITQSICADSYFFRAGCGQPNFTQGLNLPSISGAPQTLTVDNTSPTASWFAHLVLDPAVMNFANVHTVIALDGTQPGTGGNGFQGAGFDNLQATASIVDPSAVPEPATGFSVLAGLLTVALFRKRLVG